MNLDIINILDNEYFGTLPSSQENENNMIISDEPNFINFSNAFQISFLSFFSNLVH
jgi:hypothetical protein